MLAKQDNELLLESEAYQAVMNSEGNHPHEGVVANIFLGDMRFDLIRPFPKQGATDKAKADAWLARLRTFLEEKVDPVAIRRNREIPSEVLAEFKAMKALGIRIPEKYGGLGFSHANYLRASIMIGSHSSDLATFFSANQIGIVGPLLIAGTERQKQTFLPRLAEGEVSGLALTEEETGSDPGKTGTYAYPAEVDGVVGDILCGKKLYTTNAVLADGKPLAKWIAVVAKYYDNKADAENPKKRTAHSVMLIVDTASPGFKATYRCDFSGIEGIQNGETTYDGVFVPRECRIGDDRSGFELALKTLYFGRFSLACLVEGGLKQAVHLARWRARTRIQERKPIGSYELKAEDVADAASWAFAMEAILKKLASLMDEGMDVRMESTMTKVWSTAMLWNITCKLMRLFGGNGYETSDSKRHRGSFPTDIEGPWRACWVFTIFEGENDVMGPFRFAQATKVYLSKVMSLVDDDVSLKQKIKGLLWLMGQFLPHPLSFFESNVSYNYPMDYEAFCIREARNIKKKFRDALYFHGVKNIDLKWKDFKVPKSFEDLKQMSKKLAKEKLRLAIKSLEKKQVISETLIERAEKVFLMGLALSYAESFKDTPMAVELARHFCDIIVEDITGARASASKKWSEKGSHNRVVGLCKRIMNGEAEWLEAGIIPQLEMLEKEGWEIPKPR